jgi:hypothetical protein
MAGRMRASLSDDMPASSGLAVGNPDFGACAPALPSPVTSEKERIAISEKTKMRFMQVSLKNL